MMTPDDQRPGKQFTTHARERLRVLIADDSVALCDRLVKMISEIAGIEIVGLSGDVLAAKAAIDKLVPNVVILDIQMPGGSGIDVLRAVKETGSSTIVIMLTNHPEPQYKHKCLELGADYFFSKSTDAQRLLALMAELASRQVPSHG